MATLYVENIPDDLYEALRARARVNRRSIAAETIVTLQQVVPTPSDLARRRAFLAQVKKLRKRLGRAVPGPTAEAMLREDRRR